MSEAWTQVKVQPYQVWRHHNGNLYTVLMITNNEGDDETKRGKYPPTVVYRGENGKVWSGPLNDWHRRMTYMRDDVLGVSHEARVNGLLNANTALVERAREAERKLKISYASNNALMEVIERDQLTVHRLAASVASLRGCLTMGSNLNTPAMLKWVAARMVDKYGESENVDFVLSLRARASRMEMALSQTAPVK